MNLKRRWIYLSLALLLFASSGYPGELPVLYRGIRPLGMGGAFITLSDDGNAMFYNPAGLNDVEGIFGGIEVLNPLIEISSNSLELFKDLSDIDPNNIDQVTDILGKNIGKHQHIRTALFPNIVFKNIAFGVLAQGTVDAEIRNRVFPTVTTDLKVDIGGLVSGAYGFLDKKLQVGVTAKFVERRRSSEDFTVSDIASETFDPLTKLQDDLENNPRSDFAFDIGLKINPPLSILNPSIAIVAANITDLDFGAPGKPDKIPQQYNIGLAINPDLWILSSTIALEVDDITKETKGEDDIYKRVHLGAELRFPAVLTIRGGINQGYYTAGISLNFWILRLEAATYSEEIGLFAGQKGDRRYLGQIVIGL